MPWMVYKGETRTLAGIRLKPGKNFLQPQELDRLAAAKAGGLLLSRGELALIHPGGTDTERSKR